MLSKTLLCGQLNYEERTSYEQRSTRSDCTHKRSQSSGHHAGVLAGQIRPGLLGHDAFGSEPADFAMKTEFTTIDGLRTAVRGQSSWARPTLLLPEPVVEYLLLRPQLVTFVGEANLVAIDLPGFGGSEGGMDTMRFDAQSSFCSGPSSISASPMFTS